MLAATFITMAPMAGWLAGTSGNRRVSTGASRRARARTMPPASATFIRPRNSAITPTSPSASGTAPSAAFKAVSASAAMAPGPWRSSLQAARAKADSASRKKTRFTLMPPTFAPA